MIYLDSAATSLLKPPGVERAMTAAVRTMSSLARGGHKAAMRAADTAFDCRSEIAEYFNMSDPAKVVFTMNATHALNIAIKSAVRKGDRVVVSGYEHNAVTRPLHSVGAEIIPAAAPLFDADAALDEFSSALYGADVCVLCHVSNVFGYIQPLPEIAELCKKRGVTLIIDAAQSAGVIDIDFPATGAEYIAMPGHKGLCGPQGTGILLCRDSAVPLIHGGTGSNSASIDMPDFLPDRLEAGTHNVAGIAGLLSGIRYIRELGADRIQRHERQLIRSLAERLKRIKGMQIFMSPEPSLQTGVLSVRCSELASEELARRLAARGVAVRAGLHCAPLAHRTAGTIDTGTIRFSVSPFNNSFEIARAAEITARCVVNAE